MSVLQRTTHRSSLILQCGLKSLPVEDRMDPDLLCLYTMTNSECFSSPGFVNLSPIAFYFIVYFVPSWIYK